MQPAVRTVIVEVGIDESGKFWTAIWPVLAIRSTIERTYSRSAERQGSAGDGSEKFMLAKGWFLESQHCRDALLVCVPESGIAVLPFDDWSLEADNVVRRPVVCNWPESEDEVKLAPTIARLRKTLEKLPPGVYDTTNQE